MEYCLRAKSKQNDILPEKDEILDRLRAETCRLRHILWMVQQDSPCICILNEIRMVKKNLTSICLDFTHFQLKASADILYQDHDPDIYTHELRKIIDLFGMVNNF
jgi:DNA-binding FrmR family transcriptional regulator